MEIRRLELKLTGADKGNPALMRELTSYKKLKAEAQREFALVAPVQRPPTLTPPARPQTAAAPVAPKPAPLEVKSATAPAPASAPAPVTATPAPVVSPAAPTSFRAPAGTPRRAILDQANNYRLGRDGKAVDANKSAALYLQAEEDFIATEVSRLRKTNGESNFMTGSSQLSSAFTESMRGNGETARAIVDMIHAKGGAHPVNLFLGEIYERNMGKQMTPEARKNMVDFAKYIQQTMGNELYSPQQSYLRDWIRQNDW